ncbi:hypothetical protein SRABI106_03588 [Rahnella aquatilis]|nr:hypothetical protein SRABI106_03588 [Rahnella aquatilis]
MRHRQSHHLHRIISRNADPALGQRHARIFAQGHAVIHVVILPVFVACARHQRLADTVAGEIPVAGMNVRIATVFIRRAGIFPQHHQQLVLGLIDRAVDIFNA